MRVGIKRWVFAKSVEVRDSRLSNLNRIGGKRIQDYLGKVVRNNVEGPLNDRLDVTTELLGAGRCERGKVRRGVRSDWYDRTLRMRAVRGLPQVSKRRRQTLETASIERTTPLSYSA
jgi:hypothetical protein